MTGAGLVVLYAVLLLWLTWPLGAHLGTHLPDTGLSRRYDNLLIGWALSHESRALISDLRTFPDANAYYPARRALFYGEAGFGALPYYMPVFLLSGNPTLALNVTFLLCIALTAAAIHWVVVRWGGSHLGGFVAAWTFLTTRWVLWRWIPSAPNYGVLQYLPFIVFHAAVDGPGVRRALALLGLVLLQSLSSFYVAAAVLLPLLALALVRLARRATRRAGLRLLAIVAGASLANLAIYSGPLLVRSENPLLKSQSVWRDTVKLPIPLGELLGGFHSPLTVPISALVLVCASAVMAARRRGDAGPRRQAWLHCTLWVAVGVLASPTPITTYHQRPIALPHALLARWTPAYDIIRVPPRLGIGALIALVILVGIAFTECARWMTERKRLPAALALVLAGLMYAEYSRGKALAGLLEAPMLPRYPLTPAISADSPLMARLREPGGPLLELPVGLARGGDVFFDAPFQAQAMYRSILHRRPILNGYNGYWPAGFPERMVLARRLPDRAALVALRQETGLALVLVHVKQFGVPERDMCRLGKSWSRRTGRATFPFACTVAPGAPERTAWLALARQGGRDDLKLLAREGSDLLFVVTPAEPRG